MKIFSAGFFNTIKEMSTIGSILRAVIYTIGHICIAMACNRIITGAPLNLAALDAIIEPIINGFWFFALDRIWSAKRKKSQKKKSKS